MASVVCHILGSIDHSPDDFFALDEPFLSVLDCVGQVFVTRYTKHTTVFKLLGEWDDVRIEKVDLTDIPTHGGIRIGMPRQVCLVEFPKEPFVPFAKDFPVLHRVGHVRRLNDVFQHYGSTTMHVLYPL